MSLKQFVKHCREQFFCGGSIKQEIDKDTDDIKEIIQLQGQHKDNVKNILIRNYNISDRNLCNAKACLIYCICFLKYSFKFTQIILDLLLQRRM